jgi:hypothetical protein
MEFQRRGHYDFRHMKTVELDRKDNQGIQNFGMKSLKGM